MRIPRPKTLLSLTLVALGLVTLPLLFAVGNAVLKLDDLMNESLAAAQASEVASREGQRSRAAIQNMLRYAQQYFALERDPARLELYQGNAEDLALSLDTLTTEPHPESVDADRATIATMLRSIEGQLIDTGSTAAAVVSDLGEMSTAVNRLADNIRDLISARLDGLEEETRSAQRTLGWQAAALIPGTVVLVLFFALLVGRPMRQIDRAIRELGKGDFSRSIAVSGPTDIETLGRQLEWLRLRLAESTEEKNKFLRHMSHELKTPLANIREGTELLLDGSVGTLDRQQEEVTGILRENSVKLQRLIENLLTFSAWQSKSAQLDLQEFELKPLVFSVLAQHRLIISNQKIKLQLNVKPIKITADEGKLRLVLENLISNAIKFTPEGGVLLVSAGAEDNTLILDVADTGPGIDREDQERVFEAFYQGRRPAKSHVGGTGIGLSVVAECVQAHGGEVKLMPSEQFGAHFRVRLPLTRNEAPARMVANA